MTLMLMRMSQKYNVYSTKAGFKETQSRDETGKWSEHPFPKSKVKDIAYHGSPEENITEFKPKIKGADGFGSWFTSDKKIAEKFSNSTYWDGDKWAIKKGRIYSAYLNIESPWILTGDSGFDEYERIFKHKTGVSSLARATASDIKVFRDYLKASGKDGVIISGMTEANGADYYVTLDPDQIKTIEKKSNVFIKAGFKEDQARDRSGKWTDKWGDMRRYEDMIKGNDFESAAIYDKDGNAVTAVKGKKYSVSFTDDEISMMNKYGYVLTHNHPLPSSLSFEDVKMLFTKNLKKIRAITKTGQVFEMEKIGDYDSFFRVNRTSPVQGLNNLWNKYSVEVQRNSKNSLDVLRDMGRSFSNLAEAMDDPFYLDNIEEITNRVNKSAYNEPHLIWEKVTADPMMREYIKYTKK